MLHKVDSRIAGTGNLKKILINLKFEMFLPILQNIKLFYFLFIK